MRIVFSKETVDKLVAALQKACIMRESSSKTDGVVKSCSYVIIALILVGMAASLISLVVIPWIQERQRQSEAGGTFGEAMMNRCLNPQAPSGDVPDIEGVPRLLVLELNHNELHEWHDLLPDERRAESSEEVDIIVCVNRAREGTEIFVEECHYEFTTETVTRYRYDPHIVALDPATGSVIATGVLEGDTPRMCPQVSSDFYPVRGELPDVNVFLDWIDENLSEAH